ncbi:MAG: hypothetical protein DRP64_15860, partial [Verrucomicrobia bacterium]
GGTLTLPADYDHFGRSGTGTFTFNQTGGTLSKPSGVQLKLGMDADTTGIVNMSAGSFDSSAYVWVGIAGHGEFNQSGGDVRIQRLSMADQSGGTGEYRISGGSLVVTDAILGSQDDVHAGKFTVSGSGATSIETMRFYGWSDVVRFELDAGGTTLIKVTPDTGWTHDAAYADLRRAVIEVDTLPGFNGMEGDVYDVLWVEDSALTGTYDGTIRYGDPYTTLINYSSIVTDFAWQIVSKQVDGKDGQMLQLIVGVMYDERYVSGLQKKFYVTDNAQTYINGSGGIAFDPTSQSGGVYDRIYLVNSTTDTNKSGLYSIDVVNETYSGRLALADWISLRSVAVDSAGAAFTSGNHPDRGVWKIADPLGAATETRMLDDYGGGTGDDDPYGLCMVPQGFGGGYTSDDLVLYDSGLDFNGNDAFTVVDAASTVSDPAFTVLHQADEPGTLRQAGSDYDGRVYWTHSPLQTADLGGTKPYITRMDNAGGMERIFLDIDPADMGILDDTIAVNPVDGSVWMAFYVPDEGNIRTVYRVDAANAVDQGGGNYLASIARVIYNVGFNNIGNYCIAISPDGKQLALVNPNDDDMMAIFDIHPEILPYDEWVAGYGLTGIDAEMGSNPDGDKLDNLSEYALGGDPTDPFDVGMTPVQSFYSDVGGDWMDYVYPKRSSPNSGISYTMEVNDDLIYGTWTNANYQLMGTGIIDAEFNAVTNRIPTDVEDKQFIRLVIEEL